MPRIFSDKTIHNIRVRSIGANATPLYLIACSSFNIVIISMYGDRTKKLGLVFALAIGLAACAPSYQAEEKEPDGRVPASVEDPDIGIPDFGGITVKNISVPIGAGDGVETVYVPAVTQMVTKRVMTMPAAIMERTDPAVTQQVNGETVIVQESVSETVTIPATFEDVEIEEIIEPERVETRPVTAAADARPQLVQVAVNPFSWD